MAVSADGFVARGPKDTMDWTGHNDKRAFRLLTSVGSVLGVGRATAEVMPDHLPGRTLHVLSNRPGLGMSIGAFAFKYPGAWLIGGQTVAMEGLMNGLVTEVHICRNPAHLGSGVKDEMTPWMASRGDKGNPGRPWTCISQVYVGDVKVEAWRLVR
jgi:dihydrofolate reductase